MNFLMAIGASFHLSGRPEAAMREPYVALTSSSSEESSMRHVPLLARVSMLETRSSHSILEGKSARPRQSWSSWRLQAAMEAGESGTPYLDVVDCGGESGKIRRSGGGSGGAAVCGRGQG